MTCDIARHSGSADSSGQPTSPSALASSVACHWWTGENAWTVKGDGGQTAVDQEHLLLARSQDVRPGDHITAVTDDRGNVVFGSADPRIVHHVGVMRSHLDCVLRMGRSIGGRS